MKKFRNICLVIIAVFLLSACTIKKPPKNLQINAFGDLKPETIIINVTSSLPKNGRLDLLIKDLDRNKVIYKTTLLTDEKGSVDKQIPVAVGDQNLEAYLIFKPEKQTKEIQAKFGKYGQNIRENAKGYKKEKKNNENYAYIKQYGAFEKYGRSGYIFFSPQRLTKE